MNARVEPKPPVVSRRHFLRKAGEVAAGVAVAMTGADGAAPAMPRSSATDGYVNPAPRYSDDAKLINDYTAAFKAFESSVDDALR